MSLLPLVRPSSSPFFTRTHPPKLFDGTVTCRILAVHFSEMAKFVVAMATVSHTGNRMFIEWRCVISLDGSGQHRTEFTIG